jgi:hypothetical protein
MTVEKKYQPEREKYAYIYAKTREDKQRWQKMADDAGYSLSSFLQGLIEDGLAYRNNSSSLSRVDVTGATTPLGYKFSHLD